MKKILLTILLLTVSINSLQASEVYIYSKTTFNLNETNVDLIGKKYIVVDIEDGVGNFFAFNKDGSLFLQGSLSAGSPSHPTPEGIFKIIQKAKYHMSNLYPSDDGKNNMNDMLKITNSGVALHKGSLNYYSHGCVHIEPSKSSKLFDWADYGTTIVITRDHYSEFVNNY